MSLSHSLSFFPSLFFCLRTNGTLEGDENRAEKQNKKYVLGGLPKKKGKGTLSKTPRSPLPTYHLRLYLLVRRRRSTYIYISENSECEKLSFLLLLPTFLLLLLLLLLLLSSLPVSRLEQSNK